MNNNQIKNLIVNNLSDHFLSKEWLGKKKQETNCHSTFGHCYLATEAAYHLLGGKEKGWKPYYLKQDGESHWFLKDKSGRILDITAEQFGEAPIKYADARGKGFLTKAPSKRCKLLLRKIRESLDTQSLKLILR